MIRDYKEGDLEEYMAVWDAASGQAHPFLEDAFVADLREKLVMIYMPMTKNWVYEQDGRVVGFIAMMGNEIGGLFVDPTAQRAGIGKALVDHVRPIFSKDSPISPKDSPISPKDSPMHDALEVEVFTENPIGRAFYKKHGFTEIAQSVHEETGNGVVRLRLSQ